MCLFPRLQRRFPLRGIGGQLEATGRPGAAIRSAVRTGDVSSSERAKMVRRPPQILVTTPESLYILLTSESGRRMLSTARTVIVDEIHAVAADKRGSHLALSLERLDALAQSTGPPLVRIGLSATQRPVEEVARFLVGTANVDANGTPRCAMGEKPNPEASQARLRLRRCQASDHSPRGFRRRAASEYAVAF